MRWLSSRAANPSGLLPPVGIPKFLSEFGRRIFAARYHNEFERRKATQLTSRTNLHYYIERVRTTILANDFSGENLPLPSMPKSVHLEEGPENHLLPFVDSFKNIMLFHLYLSEDLELGLHVIGEFLDRHTDSNLAEAESLRSSTIVARLSRI